MEKRMDSTFISTLSQLLLLDVFASLIPSEARAAPGARVKTNSALRPIETSAPVPVNASNKRADGVATSKIRTHNLMPSPADSPDKAECILLFGAFCNGNLGDVIQPIAMEHLLASVAPDQCFWYAHPKDEVQGQGHGVGEFFGAKASRLIHLGSTDAELVNQFKAFVIGGGAIFVAQHRPLYADEFVKALKVPIIIMGVGASSAARASALLIKKALFVSGQDVTSTRAFSSLLRIIANPAVEPDDVVLVRDPVLSNKALTDEEGKCWKQSEDENQPLCFVLPALNTASTVAMHKQLVSEVIRPGDVLVNIFPKHQEEIEAYNYPGIVEQILDPAHFTNRLCSCRAIISAGLHGAILGLHMGVPTFGALHVARGNKVPELMIDILRLPEQFFLVNEHLTREIVDLEVSTVRHVYANGARRTFIHALISQFYDDFEFQAKHVLFDIIGVPQPPRSTTESSEWMASKAYPMTATDSQKPKVPSRMPGSRVTNWANILSPEMSVPETIQLSTPKESTKSVADAWIALGRHNTVNTFSEADASDAKLKTEAVLASKDPPLVLETRVNTATTSDTLAWYNTIPTGTLMANDYAAAVFLTASIMALAFFPVGRFLRRSSLDKIAGKGIARGGHAPSRREVTVRVASEADQSASQQASTVLPITGGAGVAAMSSKISFMLNFVAWVSLAVGFKAYGESYLRETRDPVGLLVLQGTTGVAFLYALGHYGALDIRSGEEITPRAARHARLVAILHTSQALLNNLTVLVVGEVAINNALEALELVVAVIFTRVLLGGKCSPSRLAAIFMIASGICLLTASRQDHNKRRERGAASVGSTALISAFLTFAAVCCNILRNVIIKKGGPIPAHQNLLACSGGAMAVGVIMMVLRQMFGAMEELIASAEAGGEDDSVASRQTGSRPGGARGWIRTNGVNASLCFIGYTFASFKLLARLNPVGHAIGSSCKRVLIFTGGLLFLGELMSLRQLGGTALALLGVLGYNLADIA